MKQTRTAAAAFDLDDLERELRKASAPRQATPADDPLAELARIVGQDASPAPGRAAPTRDPFEEFLAQTAATSPNPVRAPAVEPLFPEGLRSAEPVVAVDSAAPQAPAVVEAPPVTPIDPLEALLAQDIGLRSGLDELPPPPAPKVPQPPSIEELLRDIDVPEPGSPTPAAVVSMPESVGADALELNQPQAEVLVPVDPVAMPEPEAAAAEPRVIEVVAEAGSSGADAIPASGTPARERPPFDDMLAEFEAAMRDAADERARTTAAAPEAVLSAPPGDIVMPPVREIPPEVSPSSMGAGMAGAAVATAAGAAVIAGRARPKRGMLLAGGAIAVAVIGLGALALFGGGKAGRVPGGPVPIIEAKSGAAKERPANPGGVDVPNQDKEILQTRAPQPAPQERVAPREEQPVDLTQAQRQAATAPAPVVRQIPGLPGVGPSGPGSAPAVTGSPPAVTSAADAAPRPVASVPIIISGQPTTPAPVAPVPAAPPAPVAAPVSAAPPAAPVVTPPASPSAVAAPRSAAAPPAQQQAAAAPPASEPRRVRSVPIRPENGEGAPQRAQTQPRVVATPAAPPAAADPNGPLSITPQASRDQAAAPRPARQAAIPQGTVPSSVPSLDDPAPAAEPTPQRASGSGSGFSVQLAAEGSEEAARTKFNRMRGQYGSVLGGASPQIRSAEVNGRSVYRVRVGNMSREEAVSMCERLKSSGGSCFVARN